MNNLSSIIPEKNIDFGKNYIEVLDNIFTGHKATLRIDKLSFTSEVENKESLIKLLMRIKSNGHYSVRHYASKGNIKKYYKSTIEIRHKRAKKVSLFICYNPKHKGVNFIRFELSPQHIKRKRMARLINFLANKRRLGDVMFMLLNNAKVTRIDIALDLYGLSTLNYYFGLDRATKGTLHNKNTSNGFGGVSLGSYYSKTQIAVYDKVRISKVKLDVIGHKALKFMRIEARIKPTSENDVYLSNLTFADKLPDPFEKLSIYPLIIKHELFKFKSFADLLDIMVIPEALSKIEKGYGKDCIRNILKKNRACLFDSKSLWKAEKMKCMELLGVLQQPAYWGRVMWEKHIVNTKCKRK